MGVGVGGYDPSSMAAYAAYGSTTPYGSAIGDAPYNGGTGSGAVGSYGYSVGMPTGSVGTGSTGLGYGGWGGNFGTPNSYLWNPNAYAPGTDGGYTPLGGIMSEQDPQTAIYRYGQQMGLPDDQSSFGKWFAAQAPKILQGYAATSVSDPLHANIQGYLGTLGGYQDWYNRFMQQAPQLRGLDPSSRGGGPGRWVPR